MAGPPAMRLDTFDDAFVIWQTVETCRAPCQQVSAALDVAELAPREVTVNVVSYKPVERTGTRKRVVCETVRETVQVPETYCVMVPYTKTVRVPVHVCAEEVVAILRRVFLQRLIPYLGARKGVEADGDHRRDGKRAFQHLRPLGAGAHDHGVGARCRKQDSVPLPRLPLAGRRRRDPFTRVR